MKKIIAVGLCIVSVLMLVSCKKASSLFKDEEETTKSITVTYRSVEGGDENSTAAYNWDNPNTGVTLVATNKNGVNKKVSVHFPTTQPWSCRFGYASHSDDGVFVLVQSQQSENIECNSAEDVLTAFYEQIKQGLQEKEEYTCRENVKLKVNKSAPSFAGNNDYYRFEGQYEYIYDYFEEMHNGRKYERGQKYSQYFVANVHQLSNGAFVYCIVIDESEHQSLKNTVDYDAKQIAKSLREMNYD